MTEEEYRAEARLIAIETMVTNIYNMLGRVVGADEAAMEASAESLRTAVATTPVLGVKPATSDHLSAEIGAHLERLLLIAHEQRQK
ncbi:hypothetical protein ACLBXM_19985 [Xanthobacteraceae bacterium A53D]